MKTRYLLCICSALLLVACSATQSGGSTASAPQSTGRPASVPASGRTTLTGTVERVWEDGFRLDTGERALNVDTWDVFGDNTRSKVSVGQRVSVSGEMSRGEFDATAVNPL